MKKLLLSLILITALLFSTQANAASRTMLLTATVIYATGSTVKLNVAGATRYVKDSRLFVEGAKVYVAVQMNWIWGDVFNLMSVSIISEN